MNRPRPVLSKAGIAGLITSVGGVLAFLGYHKQAAHLDAEAQGIAGVAIAAILLASHLLPALSAQKDVTPKHSAQADDGMPLIRADQVVPMPQYVTVNQAPTGATDDPDAEEGLPVVSPAATDVPDAATVLAAADEIHPSEAPPVTSS